MSNETLPGVNVFLQCSPNMAATAKPSRVLFYFTIFPPKKGQLRVGFFLPSQIYGRQTDRPPVKDSEVRPVVIEETCLFSPQV